MAIVNAFPGAVLHPSQYFGYPYVGSGRRIKASILAVIHTTETYGVPYPSDTKSWTFSVERDGTVHQFLDPVTQVAWTNGDLKSPDLTNPLVKAMVGSPYNANEFCFLTIENVNRIADGQRLTDAQLAADHAIIMWAHGLSGIPVDRTHIIGHYQINGETRVNCPTVPTDRQRVFNGVIAAGAGLPDTSLPEVDSMLWADKVKPVDPFKVEFVNPTNFFTQPILGKAYILAGSPFGGAGFRKVIIGETVGTEYPAGSGNTKWDVFVSSSGGFLCYPSSTRGTVTPLGAATDCSAVEADLAQAESDLIAANKRIAKIKLLSADSNTNIQKV